MTNDVIQTLEQSGYVRRRDFCLLCNRTDGGNIIPLAKKHGVAMVQIPLKGETDKVITLLLASDAGKIPPVEKTAPRFNGNNGGLLKKEIAELKRRVSFLEEQLGI